MKYIKKYENFDYEELKVGDYIICDDIRVDGISVYRIRNISAIAGLALKILYRYDKGEEQLLISPFNILRDMVYYGNHEENLNIYYHTRNLEDAIDKVPLIYNTNKYNI